MAEQLKKTGFKSVQLFKDQTLGIGSYGAVCQAKCDDLVCAAKIIHPTLYDPMVELQISPQREHRLPMRRFEQECEFLSSMRHPNIILYLGMHRDGDTGLPVLLMELMDDSLTHFLESSTQTIPYHIQVNICHDIALALSFLHANNIVHRDLSSNNVLLRGNILAKVTDFGMARLMDVNRQRTDFTNTMCPGTDVYMPPEAVDEKTVYTEKIDCFSFGVIALQILTKLFPQPGARVETINDPRYPRAIKMNILEIERRQSHIRKVDPNHPLLPVVLDCLKDDDSERPSAEQLCETTASLKGSVQYSEAREGMNEGPHEHIQTTQEQLQCNDSLIASREQELREVIQKKSRDNEQQNREIQRLKRDGDEKQKQLSSIIHQLKESEKVIADFERQVAELKRLCSERGIQCHGDSSEEDSEAVIKIRWREGEKAPSNTSRHCDCVVEESIVYCKYVHNKYGQGEIYAYNAISPSWSMIPHCPIHRGFAITVIKGALTTVGGIDEDDECTSKLLSLKGSEEDGDKRWTEEFPPMPTKRYSVSALSIGAALVVAGGKKDGGTCLRTVEVMNTHTREWHTATELPQPLAHSSMTVCGDFVYLLGGYDKEFRRTRSVYSCPLTALLMSLGGRLARALSWSSSNVDIWARVADLPVAYSSAVTLCGQLIAVGGVDSNDTPTSDVQRYDQATNSWKVISHMATPRSRCFAAVLPDYQLMVVGGWNSFTRETDSVELGRVVQKY